MENNPLPIVNSQQTTNAVGQASLTVTQPSIVDSRPKANNNFLVVLLSVLLFVSVSIAGFFAYQTQKLVKELTMLKTSPTPEVTTEPVATVDPTAGWNTYTNNVLKYAIKYPNDWTLDKSEAELPINDQNSQKLVISKGEYKITILWPSAFGPGICLFDDESRINAPEMASYCEGKFIETKNNSGTIVHRRLSAPNKYNEFEVYTFDKTYFVTVPPIRFYVPADYNNQTVSLMDQILLTYTPTN